MIQLNWAEINIIIKICSYKFNILYNFTIFALNSCAITQNFCNANFV